MSCFTYETIAEWWLKFGQQYTNELKRQRARPGGKWHLDKVFLKKLLKGCQYVPRVIITDKLASYAAAKQEIMASVEHRRHKGSNNRAENSHQPTRQRERTMRRFTSPGHAQRFLSAFGRISDHFRPKRHCLNAPEYRVLMQGRFHVWNEVTRMKTAA